jgi:hypothetical protein
MISVFIIFVYMMLGLIVIASLIYLIAKRINDKANEDFEKRDN